MSLTVRGFDTTAALLFMAAFSVAAVPARAQTIPADAVPFCPLASTAAFNAWFQSGSASPNGFVLPADGIAFTNPSTDNCPFYHWAERMFLWVTSPIMPNSGYGGVSGNSAQRVFDSTAFFDVSGSDVNGNRTLIPHPKTVELVRLVSLRAGKAGPHGLPIVRVKGGPPVELLAKRSGSTGKALITDASGKEVEISRVVVRRNRATLYNNLGKAIVPAQAQPTPRRAERFRVAMPLHDICSAGVVCTGGPVGGVIDTATEASSKRRRTRRKEGLQYFPCWSRKATPSCTTQ